jgi:hypothetical protein
MAPIFNEHKHKISVGIGIIKQVVNNRSHPLDIIREALSNSCSTEVQAAQVKINIFYEPQYGWSMSFEDNGIGMDYTGEEDPSKKGRLDKFLDLSYSGVMGLKADEFSYKGLGAKLMYLSKKLEIDTKLASGKSYKVIVEDPMGKLLKKEPELPEPSIYDNPPLPFEHGTVIRVYGYDNGEKYPEYEHLEKLEEFLYYRTIVGCVDKERVIALPEIFVNTPDGNKKLELGYKWVKREGTHIEGQIIGLIEPPIVVSKTDTKGRQLTIKLKGGYALKTSEFDIGGYGISKGGLQYAWKGIPYFHLDYNQYRSSTKLDLYSKFCRLVVECDNIELNMSRSEISTDSTYYPLFEKALLEAFRRIKETEDYKTFVKTVRDLRQKELAVSLNERVTYLERNTKWVFVNGELIHKVPENESDTHALLWKLESAKLLPFQYFKTLEHTAQVGIDIIGEYQENAQSLRQVYRAIEVEHMLENYGDHDHVPEQTSLIIAWDAKSKDELTKVEGEYKYIWHYDAKNNIPVYLIRHLPNLEIRDKK